MEHEHIHTPQELKHRWSAEISACPHQPYPQPYTLPAQNQQSQFICLPLGSVRQIRGWDRSHGFLGFSKDLNFLGGSIFNIPQGKHRIHSSGGGHSYPAFVTLDRSDPWTLSDPDHYLCYSTQESPSPKDKPIPR